METAASRSTSPASPTPTVSAVPWAVLALVADEQRDRARAIDLARKVIEVTTDADVELAGSIVTATRPFGLFAGQPCMNFPIQSNFCDHGEQMIPPVQALGQEYAGVMYRPRVPAEHRGRRRRYRAGVVQ